MKLLLKHIQFKKALWLPALIIASLQTYGQQLSDPTQNAPTGATINLTAADTVYPAIFNMTNPSGLYNYVRNVTPDVPLQSLPASGIYDRVSTDYYDGLGRPLQTVGQRSHADGNDIVVPHVYDALGREAYQFLPYAAPTGVLANPGKMKLNVNTQLHGFYNKNGIDEQPYSQTLFENSPLERITTQMAPGKSWVGSQKGSAYNYKSNTAGQYSTGGANPTLYTIHGSYPRFSIGSTNTSLPQYAGEYADGTLYISTATDEDGKLSEEIKDMQGRTVIKRSLFKKSTAPPFISSNLLPTNYAYTFYVYDEIGRLRSVIPPAAAVPILSVQPVGSNFVYNYSWNSITQQVNDNLCYTNFYDERGRVIEKKIPGKDVEYFVYDLRDRPIMHQDGNLRNAVGYGDGLARWLFTYYDALNRPIISTICAANENGSAMAGYINDNSVWAAPHWLHYFKDYAQMATYPTSIVNSTILNYTYYDDYSQTPGFSFDASQFNNISLSADGTTVPSVYSPMTKGLVTGSKTRVTDPEHPTTELWLTTVNFYDDKGRVIQTQSQNINGGLDISSNIYYFQGELYKIILRHQNPHAKVIPGASDGPITQYTVQNTYQRNLGIDGGNDQVWKHTQMINGSIDYELAYYDYDHLGRPVVKQFTAGNLLQEYSIHGMLNHLNFRNTNSGVLDTFFEEKLYYDMGFGNKFLNGNIAGITWRGLDDSVKSYGYSYDSLNRLNHAEFRLFRQNAWGKSKDYTASNISYDDNGNILTMNQKVTSPTTGITANMDILTYGYAPNSNKLVKVTDAVTPDVTLPDFKDGANNAAEYRYDSNGNLVADDNKSISSISYNDINRPTQITVTGTAPGTVTYVYDASGNKLRKKVYNPIGDVLETYDYIGNFVYKNDVLQYILNDEGRARPIAADSVPGNPAGHPTKFVYDYFIKDHLGNVRSTVTASPMSYPYLAKHEIATANIEQLIFDNIPNVRDIKPGSNDPNDGMAAGLDASDPNTRIGTAILLKSFPGDRFRISADAFYDGEYGKGDIVSTDEMVQSLITTLTGGSTYAGVPLSELPDNIKTINTLFADPNIAQTIQQLSETNDNPDAPKAHLNYLWFDENMRLDPKMSGSVQVPVFMNGSNNWVTLSPGVNGVTPTQCAVCVGNVNPGYLLVYIDNQSIGKKVWFDNVAITEYTSAVTEEDHYYPYGLTINTFNSNTLQNGVKQPYLLTTKELESHFGINSYDFGARMQDMQLGRWWQIDPLSERYNNWSPYIYCGNNPAKLIDNDGREIEIAYYTLGANHPELKSLAIYRNGKLYNTDGSKYTGNNDYILQTQSDYNDIVAGGGIAADMINHLENSENVHVVGNMDFTAKTSEIKNDPNYDYKNYERSVGSKGSFTKYGGKDKKYGYNPKTKKAELTSRDRKKGLGHEMEHAFDKDIGKPSSEEDKDSEGRAISIENTINPEEGKRYYHGGNEYNEKDMEEYRKQIKKDLDDNKKQ
jgi:RHS repeat-associated protein